MLVRMHANDTVWDDSGELSPVTRVKERECWDFHPVGSLKHLGWGKIARAFSVGLRKGLTLCRRAVKHELVVTLLSSKWKYQTFVREWQTFGISWS